MPKFVTCPTCQTDVKVPRDAATGTVLTCPDCAEEFVPKHLKPKGYDPMKAASYAVDDAQDDEERFEKKRKAKALMAHGRQTNRDRQTHKPPPFFSGFEFALLIIAIVAGFAALVGYVVANRAPNTGEAALIILGYCGMMLMFGWRKLIGARKRIEG